MFVPEYSITPAILKNLSVIEYSRALIENTPILQHWENQLEKETKVKLISNTLGLDGIFADPEGVKRILDGIETKKIPEEIRNFLGLLKIVEEINRYNEIDENNLLALHKIISEDLLKESYIGRFRAKKYDGHSEPEEILADIVSIFDWINSIDAKETHPILVSGIVFARLIYIWPFENFNFTIAAIITKIVRKIAGYEPKSYVCVEDYLNKNQRQFENASSDEYTDFLEFYTRAFASETANIKEKIILLSRDTKVAKASGTIDLTARQSRIVEYLQDYGILQNKDFNKLFDSVSDDSVLRDLKTLVSKGIVIKKGSTKSSRYELK